MDITPEGGRRLRCALFVDFDNVYIGLQRLDPSAAEAFAGSPAHWLAGLETGSDADGEFTRRFLVRSCYLNPSVFSQFRPNFTRAGFSVVDCPSLTQQGKSSADINLVLDAVDALSAETRYDEFVILSADADFTPLALRCRAADRRVTIITAGPAASAYRAVADTVITADELAEIVKHPEQVELDDTPAPAPVAAPGNGTGRASAPSSSSAAARASGPVTNSPARKPVLRLVRAADRPLTGSVVAQAAQKADPSLVTSNWEKTGAFFPWLARAVPELQATARPAPGFVWDPKRFSEADVPSADAVDLPPLQRQVVDVTDIPNLPAESYRILLSALAEDVRAVPFARAETSRRVRDACQAAGAKIGRGSVNTVIAGVLYAGLDLAAKPSAREVAETWADNVIGLCRGARMELGPQAVNAIRAWVGGGLLSS
ncbi:NYN domain-containing protein [Pengzhenrongella sicca]|uniref:NYN domain-containing protein n=1 Tax=Pengzhenrongella sicca TaxID=2819238 RepID=A0A8A4ZGH4_9MICO|nr:NYN domain-containing protein [Pengzhenrongella sicca]QTE30994.1 NYN domain-containing protein [Pengzhenrongella sicca]